MKNIFIACLLVLTGCVTATPYEYASRETAPNEFEIVLKAKSSDEIDQLKNTLIAKGDELCGHRIFRLRGLREDTYFNPPAQELKGDIECMNEPS